jgi:peptidylprolyl isomerase domain and WD repeat-containing protein 1
VSASQDGHVKFWKKQYEGIEFVKHYRAHKGPVNGLDMSNDGRYLVTIGKDQALKFFDVVAFDMISMTMFDYEPLACAFVHRDGAAAAHVAVSNRGDGIVRIYNVESASKEPVRELRNLHEKPPHVLKYHEPLHLVLSADTSGAVEVWDPDTLEMPRNSKAVPQRKFKFSMKMETNLYELLKNQTYALTIATVKRPDDDLFAILSEDGNVRLFRFSTCKLMRTYDESLDSFSTAQSDPNMKMLHLDRFDFGRRMATEKEMQKSPYFRYSTLSFDETGNFILFPSILGVKLINLHSNKLVRILGKVESSERFLAVSLYSGKPKKKRLDGSVFDADGNTATDAESDPMLICSSFKKNRFYVFSKREPAETSMGGRDVFNEKPTKEDQEQAQPELGQELRLGKRATIHTTMGDIVVKLFPKECPRTVENFTVHSRNGYYDNIIFHRIIPGFMVQTGDPNGDGTGGESIWGGDFEDEFNRSLKHDRPFTLSMANAGPNTNGSQFFITTVACSWLDGKHTVFGRVEEGTDTVKAIEKTPCNGEDKPLSEIRILAIKVTG